MVKVLRSFVCGPLEPHITGFAKHLLRQGYTQSSAEQQVCFLAHLDRWMSAEGVGLDGLTCPVIQRYLERRCAAGYVEYRSLKAVPPVAGWRLSSLPKGLEPGELRRLLGACDRRTPTGRRDYAILLLLSRLGLRAGEVARLGLDDIDWRRGEITIVGKAGAVRVNGSSDPPP